MMRVPGRLHITWDNDATLKIETEAGEQTRLFHFGSDSPGSDALISEYCQKLRGAYALMSLPERILCERVACLLAEAPTDG